MKNLFTSILLLFAFSMSAQVANDVCANAQAIIIPASGSICVSSTNIGATSDGSTNTCDTGTPGNEVWFSFIASGTNNTITVTPSGTSPATSIVVTMTGSSCTSGTYDL